MRGGSPDPLGKPLSPQEAEVEVGLMSKKTGRQIALDMDMTYAMFKNYCRQIYEKRGVSGRIELMAARIKELEAGS